VVAHATSKGVSARLSHREFQLCAPTPTLPAQIKRRYIVDIVLAQMIATGLLIFGFSIEVLRGKV
jgi:hypothetical protein